MRRVCALAGLIGIGCTPNSADESNATDTSATGTDTQASSETETDTGESADEPPPQPADLVVYTTGDPADADVDPSGPGLILMGGGVDVDVAFTWQASFIAGGDIVVLRSSGADGYNDYLYADIGGADSVQTLMVDARELAEDPWVAWTVDHAEAVFMAGGDQAQYVEFWQGTALADAIARTHARGAIIGGTSAGLAIMGEFAFAALEGTVYADEMLEDPYNAYATLERDVLRLPELAGVITDSHFFERDRMGRLLGFGARILEDGWADTVVGIGVDEATALLIGPDGVGEIVGSGAVYLMHADAPAQLCTSGQPLEFGPVSIHRLAAGDTASWPGGHTDVPAMPVSASAGATVPASPY